MEYLRLLLFCSISCQ